MPEATYSFAGRTVIVTGAAHGIGRAVAARFHEAKASVIVADVDQGALSELDLPGATTVVADVSQTRDVERLVTETLARTGRIDVIVNNAGVLHDRVLWKLADEDWERVLAVHLGGTFRLTRACVPHFRERGYGRVVNVTSYTGLHGNVGQSAYAAAKAGIVGFTKTAAKELAAFGVTVNAISPNAQTRMVDSIPPDKLGDLTKLIPLGRFAEPSEIATAAMFLASEEAGYITGAVLPVDGGLSM
jgi:3-oxoacyl-[acyl-carrier protein] reductase